ncbi:MAG: exosortase system-associated protein, TIGR04073 family [Candidatus Omnitrophica bacterium]|nr:exosortase system-associated protein, TIGR04073 family [Candidatus Omnitrophota bacterium]
MRVRGRWVAVGACVVGLSVPTAWAATDSSAASGGDRIEDTMSRYNVQPALDKLGRGATNFLGGWLEIPYTIHQHSSQSDTAGSFLTGTARGAVRGAIRTAVGLYEMVTFCLPYPEQYAPILPTLGYFDKRGRSKRLPLE